MSDNKSKELPACPVKTTLTLIGDKKRFGELKKINRQRISKGAYCSAL